MALTASKLTLESGLTINNPHIVIKAYFTSKIVADIYRKKPATEEMELIEEKSYRAEIDAGIWASKEAYDDGKPPVLNRVVFPRGVLIVRDKNYENISKIAYETLKIALADNYYAENIEDV